MLLPLVVAVSPAVFLLVFFYLRDRWEPEPVRHVVAAFALGAYAMVASHGVAVTLEGWIGREWLLLGGWPAKCFDAFVLAGVVEELSKLFLLVVAVFAWDEFDEPMDGIVYGVAVSLGFAAVENVLFVTSRGLEVAWLRAIFAVPAHALFGATMGYYLGRAKFDERRRNRLVALGALLAILAHGAYDLLLQVLPTGLPLWVALVVVSVVLWVFVMRRVGRASEASPFRPDETR